MDGLSTLNRNLMHNIPYTSIIHDTSLMIPTLFRNIPITRYQPTWPHYTPNSVLRKDFEG